MAFSCLPIKVNGSDCRFISTEIQFYTLHSLVIFHYLVLVSNILYFANISETENVPEKCFYVECFDLCIVMATLTFLCRLLLPQV